MEQAPQQIIDWIRYYSQGLPKQFLIGNLINPIFLPSYVDDIIEFSNIGTNGLPGLPVPGEQGKIYVNVDDGTQWRANNTGTPPYYYQITNGFLDAISFEFMSGVLTTNYYPSAMKINSITNVKNAPTTTITKNGSAYTLGSNIAMGDTLVITVSTASVIRLNVQYV